MKLGWAPLLVEARGLSRGARGQLLCCRRKPLTLSSLVQCETKYRIYSCDRLSLLSVNVNTRPAELPFSAFPVRSPSSRHEILTNVFGLQDGKTEH